MSKVIEWLENQWRIRRRRLLISAIKSAAAGNLAWRFRRTLWHRGTWINTDSDVVSRSARSYVLLHAYERAECKMITRHVPSVCNVVELGSNIGVTSSLIASRLAPGAHLVCVEPNRACLPLLERNVRRNVRPGVEWTVVNAAVFRSDSHVAHMSQSNDSLTNTIVAVSEPREGYGIPTITLKSALERFHDDLAMTVLVADIEGAERHFIMGGDLATLRGIDRIIIELHDSHECRAGTLLDVLVSDHDFEVMDAHGNVVALWRRSEACPP